MIRSHSQEETIIKKWSWIILIAAILMGAFFLFFQHLQEEKKAAEEQAVKNAVEDYLFKER
ncbi:hypothetical protein P4T04_14700 [Bacillus badius]|uniref:hypothetical protein n=1 Tax=Bacillus badius TaxID=1455 RepID=UPI0007B0BAB6|nr:hypothetical protein [Bacillus badius]KZN99170.1 hypothetical protein A4244_08765 [Bacillus badius]MED0667574.1 hypothetical protein [Bacillus badius]OCS84106.1 hypothetical protein A6M11_08775 [Bacillus badius]